MFDNINRYRQKSDFKGEDKNKSSKILSQSKLLH